RHTRSIRDWSSDVCSSDLAGEAKVELSMNGAVVFDGAGTEKQTSAVSGDAFSLAESDGAVATSCPLTFALSVPDAVPTALSLGRSEERRVGEGCRRRWGGQ